MESLNNMQKKYELLIFDQDDTLFDYAQTECQAVKFALLKLGINPPTDFYCIYKKANTVAKTMMSNYILNLEVFRRIRAELFLSNLKQTKELSEEFIALYLSASEYGVLLPNVFETLSQIETPMVVGTNGSSYPRFDRLKNSEIFHLFKGFYSSEELGISKPNPDFFKFICEQHNALPENSLVVGDRVSTDIWGAHNAGLDSCLISTKTCNEKLPPNTQVISNMIELLGVI